MRAGPDHADAIGAAIAALAASIAVLPVGLEAVLVVLAVDGGDAFGAAVAGAGFVLKLLLVGRAARLPHCAATSRASAKLMGSGTCREAEGPTAPVRRSERGQARMDGLG